jgi:hypothetical protein
MYEDNADFNDSVDDSHGMIRIFDSEFRPSEVLFVMEPETYRVYLADFDSENSESGAVTEVTNVAELQNSVITTEDPPLVQNSTSRR